MQAAFYLAGEITQVKESIPWVRCASGNVSSNCVLHIWRRSLCYHMKLLTFRIVADLRWLVKAVASHILTALLQLYRLISNTWQTSVSWLIRTSAWYVGVATARYLLLNITITPPPFPHLIRSLTFEVFSLFYWAIFLLIFYTQWSRG